MVNMSHYDAFCFDLDGTILLGNEILPGAKEIIELIRKNNKKVLFVTNSPTQTRKECKQRLHTLGIAADLEEVFTSLFISAMYFSERFPESQIYIVGEEAIEEEFNQFSLKITKNPLEANIYLWDTIVTLPMKNSI